MRTAPSAEAEWRSSGARVALAPGSELRVLRLDGTALQLALSNGRIGIHLAGTGQDDHHLVEAAFKSLALALRAACTLDGRRRSVPSTKGAL